MFYTYIYLNKSSYGRNWRRAVILELLLVIFFEEKKYHKKSNNFSKCFLNLRIWKFTVSHFLL